MNSRARFGFVEVVFGCVSGVREGFRSAVFLRLWYWESLRSERKNGAGGVNDVIKRFKEGSFGPGSCTFGAVSHLRAQRFSFTCVATKAEGFLILLVSNNLGLVFVD